MRQACYRVVASLVCVVAIPLLASAQNVPKRIFVGALDTGGRPVADLTAADFQITETASSER